MSLGIIEAMTSIAIFFFICYYLSILLCSKCCYAYKTIDHWVTKYKLG